MLILIKQIHGVHVQGTGQNKLAWDNIVSATLLLESNGWHGANILLNSLQTPWNHNLKF